MHPLAMILLITTMAIMSGCLGQRATGDFVKKHEKALRTVFKPKKDRLPSYQTIARVMQNTDFEALSNVFMMWSQALPGTKIRWIALDGKAIGGTVKDPHDQYQQYTHLVSAFATERFCVLAQKKTEVKHNEIPLVKQLIRELALEGVVFTTDALHCQKDTTKAIIQSKNDYVLGVKGNQPKLLSQLKKTAKAPKRSITM
jgi:DDE_Tnp_1-associated/Transposase DDE domain